MSLKVHFLHLYLSFSPENVRAISNEHGERLHQDITAMESRYKRKWSPAIMLADFWWNVIRDQPEVSQTKKKVVMNTHFYSRLIIQCLMGLDI